MSEGPGLRLRRSRRKSEPNPAEAADSMSESQSEDEAHYKSRTHRRRRMRRHGRRAYVRSIYFLPSLATLGNLVCGFGAMYVATLSRSSSRDPLTNWFFDHHFVVAAY